MEYSYNCKVCGISSKTINDYHTHYNLYHLNNDYHQVHASTPFKCDRCEKSFSSGENLRRHKKRIHNGKIFHCDLCEFTTGRKESLNRHNVRVHGSVSGHQYPEENRIVSHLKDGINSGPFFGNGGACFSNAPQKSYTESLATEYDSEFTETNYHKNVVHERGEDCLDEDSDSMSSEHSEDNCDMDYITEKGHKILRRCGELLTEFVDLSTDWKTITKKMHKEIDFHKDYKGQVRDLMAQVAIFDERIKGINRIHNEIIDKEKVYNKESDDQSETEDGDEHEVIQEYEDEEVDEHKHIEDNEEGKETDEEEEEEDEVEENEDHGITCFQDIVEYFEFIVDQHPWAKQTFDRIKIQGRVQNHYKDESESSQVSDSDNEEERSIREEPVTVNKLIDMKNTVGKFLDGVKYEGNSYLKKCSKKEIKHIGKCCNMFWFDSLPIGDRITRKIRNVHLNKIKQNFL